MYYDQIKLYFSCEKRKNNMKRLRPSNIITLKLDLQISIIQNDLSNFQKKEQRNKKLEDSSNERQEPLVSETKTGNSTSSNHPTIEQPTPRRTEEQR